MSVRTRYLQINPTTMMEFSVNEYDEQSTNDLYIGKLLSTKLLDGHQALLSPGLFEVKQTTTGYVKLPQDDVKSINTLNHFAVPADKLDNRWFMFLDPDYKYNTADNVSVPKTTDLKVSAYIRDADEQSSPARVDFKSLDVTAEDEITYSTLKLYFTTGYDFTDMYGALIRLYVNTLSGGYVDLCNFVYTRSEVYKHLTYMANPIVFGNFIYDRYIAIKVPSVTDLINTNIGELDIDPSTSLKLMFSYISENDTEIGSLETRVSTATGIYTTTYKNVLCKFSRANNIKGSIPPSKLPSDNLGVHIESSPTKSYIEFYGTWNDSPLSTSIVQKFNRDIKLYDQSIVRRGEVTYEVDRDYTPEYNLKKWLAMHEITCDLVDEDLNVVDSETYEVSQTFERNTEAKTFYYRPVIFDESLIDMINDRAISAMVITYSMRFVNIDDSVQFLKMGSMSISASELGRFCKNGTNLNFSDRLPYKVYNRIVEQKQTVTPSTFSNDMTTKYVKNFYNATTVKLSNNGDVLESGTYELMISPAPKNYKFVFKQEDMNGNYKFMDLTDTYYKLYAKGGNGTEVIIDPTYSKNMNMILGELEFCINASDIAKLRDIETDRRTISIVAYNADNSVSTMYDMKYYFV